MRILFSIIACVVVFGPDPAAAFDFQMVIDKAKSLATASYQAPQAIPKFMRELSYSQYQDIRFDPEKSLWRDSKSNFQVMLIPAGLFYSHAVAINIVDSAGTHPLVFNRDTFTCNDPDLAKRIPPDLGYAGFKLTYPLQKEGRHDQFLAFAGASYFRLVGKDNAFGLSARGAALDTGLPSGEEFPSFVEFWLVRPSPEAKEMLLYALLDGPSMTGAYAFTIKPGATAIMDVKARIFARTQLKLLGMAPLTSMFYYGENTARPIGEWRSQVHDSDGLLIHNGTTGEWLWRPLVNPKTVQMDSFSTENVRGFGLMQRDREFRDYLDAEAQYHIRPSAWVEPQGDWGLGQIVLVQLPSPDETNDNIVAFWSREGQVSPEKPLSLEYSLRFGDAGVAGEPLGQAINTLVGDGNRTGGGSAKGAYRLIVDFSGGPLDKLSSRANITGTVTALENGEILDHYVEFIPSLHCWRLSILAKPHETGPLNLRAFLHSGQEALTETWTYRLAGDNDIRTLGD
jgi:periplasmic glucans biosynthesis protein